MLNSASGFRDPMSSSMAFGSASDIKKNQILPGITIEGVAESSSVSDSNTEQGFQTSPPPRFTLVEPGVKVTISEEASLQDSTQSLPQSQAVYSKSQLQSSAAINGSVDSDSNLSVEASSNTINSDSDHDADDTSSTQDKTAVDSAASNETFTDAELKQIDDLEQRQAEVIRHEQAHAAQGGSATGAPQYEYTTGPDGKRYAVNGEVSVNFAEGSPEQRIADAQSIIQAALAPAEPSSQDRAVAREASQRIQEAQQEIEQSAEQDTQEAAESDSFNGERRFSSDSIAASGPEKMKVAPQIPTEIQSNNFELPLQESAQINSTDFSAQSEIQLNTIQIQTQPINSIDQVNRIQPKIDISNESNSTNSQSEVILKDEVDRMNVENLMTYARPNTNNSNQFLNQPEPGSLISAMA